MPSFLAMKKIATILPFVLLLQLFILGSNATAALYRWTDEDGKIHYTDSIPPEAVGKGGTILNQRGVPIKELKPALTPEERAVIEEAERKRAAEKEHAKRIANNDRALMAAYRSEDDILLARDGKIASITATEGVIKGNIMRARQQLRQKKALGTEQFKKIEQQLANNYRLLIEKDHDKQAVYETFHLTLMRYRHIKKKGIGNMDPVERGSMDITHKKKSLLLTCPDPESCSHWWQRTKTFITFNSDTSLAIDSEQLLVSEVPVKKDEISLSAYFTMADDPTDDNTGSFGKLLLDISCHPSAEGDELCRDQRAQKMREAFRPVVTQLEKAL